jgi:transcriptional regulator
VETRTELLRGTLDLLILRSLATESRHGLGIARRIGQMTRQTFDVKPGSLFPALYRLEERGLVTAEWGQTPEGRRAKFYALTREGRRQLQREEAQWQRVSAAMAHALAADS